MGDDGTKWTVAMIALSVVILGAVVLAGSKSNPAPTGPTLTTDQTALLAVRSDDHSRGSKDAKTTLIEYGDFQCPACATVEPHLQKLVAEHGNEVRVIFRNFPLPQHANGELMSRAAEAADKQGQYWEMHDRIYQEQEAWTKANNAQELATQYAHDLGLVVDKFDSDLFDQSIADRITQDKQAASTLALQGTPSFFLNGQVLPNPKSYEDLVKAIQAAGK